MLKIYRLSLCGTLLLIAINIYSQQKENVFYQFDVDKTLTFKYFDFNITAEFKQLINGSNKWNRAALNPEIYREFKNNFVLYAGLSNLYTFQEEESNLFEFRPWVAVKLNSPIIKRIKLQQRLKMEWRNFFYEKVETKIRVRYKVDLNINLALKIDKPNPWQIKTGVEWYFVSNNSKGERFNNSQEFSIYGLKKLKNENVISIGYLYEKLNELYNANSVNGYTLILQYSF